MINPHYVDGLELRIKELTAELQQAYVDLEAVKQDALEWRHATARAVSLLQLHDVPTDRSEIQKAVARIKALNGADVLDAEADLILEAPADAQSAGNIWSESDQKIALKIGSMLKSRAALLRAKAGKTS